MKKINWSLIIAIILIVVLLIIIINNQLSSPDKEKQEEPESQKIQESEYTNLQSANDDFAAIDETLEMLD